MHAHLRIVTAFDLLAASCAAALADQPRARGHALGPDLAALARPQAAPRGGHALGPDIAALQTPIGCAANPAADSPCATSTIALDE
jgi:hypothetical protein